jgi:Fe-S oxidoreductase
MEEDYIEEMKAKIIEATSKCRICMSCYADCPLQESTRGYVTQGPSGITKAIYYGILWDIFAGKDAEDLRDIVYACTTCGACVARCKKSACGINVVEVIETGRRLLIEKMIGPLPDQIKILESLNYEGNPYDEMAEKRTKWLELIDKGEAKQVKVLKDSEKIESLLFVGCTSSYDRDLVKIPGSIVKLFNSLKIDYGILRDEKCCGDPALRLGEVGLFEDFSEQNTEMFKNAEAKRIVNICPHGYHTLKNNYANLPDGTEVIHYTEFLAKSIEAGTLSIKTKLNKKVTFHDPCYLGKRNNLYDAPRKILKKIADDNFVEMKRNRSDSLCCGGGGGRMFAEVEETDRLSETRVRHALEVRAEIIATACPWCYIQLSDGIKTSTNEGKIVVRDIAQLLVECV